MYVGTKYEEERRIQEKRKKEGSRCRGRCYLSRQISTLFFGSAKVETSKSCLWTRRSTLEYVAHNYILHKVLKYESRKKAPPPVDIALAFFSGDESRYVWDSEKGHLDSRSCRGIKQRKC